MEGGKFDFKKAQRELIRKELRPILYEYGFVLCGPTAYIRERGGLLQEFYFKVEVSKLRPWVSYRPVFDARPIVSFGSDGPNGAKYENPYRVSLVFYRLLVYGGRCAERKILPAPVSPPI